MLYSRSVSPLIHVWHVLVRIAQMSLVSSMHRSFTSMLTMSIRFCTLPKSQLNGDARSRKMWSSTWFVAERVKGEEDSFARCTGLLSSTRSQRNRRAHVYTTVHVRQPIDRACVCVALKSALPSRYKKIHKQQPVLNKWVDKLIGEGTIKREWYEVRIGEDDARTAHA